MTVAAMYESWDLYRVKRTGWVQTSCPVGSLEDLGKQPWKCRLRHTRDWA